MFLILHHHQPLNKQSAVLILLILKTKVNFPIRKGLLHSVDDGLTVSIIIILYWKNNHMSVTQCGGTGELLDIGPNIITLLVMYCNMTVCLNQL